MKITAAQQKKLQCQFRALNLREDDKRALIYAYTNEASTSSRDLSFDQAKALITQLEQQIAPAPVKVVDPVATKKQGMRRYLMSQAIQAGYYKPNPRGGIMCDLAKLQAWIDHHGKIKKPLNSMDVPELNQVIRQMELHVKVILKQS
jgi:hypothetical protein